MGCPGCQAEHECETVDLTRLYCQICEHMAQEDIVSEDDLECIAHYIYETTEKRQSDGARTLPDDSETVAPGK